MASSDEPIIIMATMYASPIGFQMIDTREAVASGDLERMKAVARETEEWLEDADEMSPDEVGDLSAALEALKLEIAKLENQESQE